MGILSKVVSGVSRKEKKKFGVTEQKQDDDLRLEL